MLHERVRTQFAQDVVAPVYAVYSLSVFVLILFMGKFLKFLQIEDAIHLLYADDEEYLEALNENSVLESDQEAIENNEDNRNMSESRRFKRGKTFNAKV